MAKINPYAFLQELDDNGDPLAGGFIDTFEAGTTTPKQTFTDSTEATPNANPVVLDASGRADIWLGTGSYKFVLKDSGGSTIKTVDNITGDSANVFGNEVTPISTNTNVTTSDENAVYDCSAVLTISLLDASTAGEGFIVGVKNRSAGDVTIDPDGLELIDGAFTFTLKTGQSVMVLCTGTEWLSMYVNDVTPNDNTFTGDNTFSGGTTFTGDVSMSSSQMQWSKGADVVSASALPIVTDGNYFDVTGTNAITSINTTGQVGTIIKLHFDGALVLTHDATNLILPSGASITTSAGDEAEFIEYDSGDFRCVNYTKASGRAIQGITIEIPLATTSGTSFDFASIPAGTKRITLSLDSNSLDGTDNFLIQLNSETTGYIANSLQIDGTPNGATSTTGFVIINDGASTIINGAVDLVLIDEIENTWQAFGVLSRLDSTSVGIQMTGTKSLSSEITQVTLTRSGANNFDGGQVGLQSQ